MMLCLIAIGCGPAHAQTGDAILYGHPTHHHHHARGGHAVAVPPPVRTLKRFAAWMCIHRGEGAWNANTGNGYYGGLQMDRRFMRSYGWVFIRKYSKDGTDGYADEWTPAEQIRVAEKAYLSGRGFYPWPNTARACGLI